jgi:hypothetical protein
MYNVFAASTLGGNSDVASNIIITEVTNANLILAMFILLFIFDFDYTLGYAIF